MDSHSSLPDRGYSETVLLPCLYELFHARDRSERFYACCPCYEIPKRGGEIEERMLFSTDGDRLGHYLAIASLCSSSSYLCLNPCCATTVVSGTFLCSKCLMVSSTEVAPAYRKAVSKLRGSRRGSQGVVHPNDAKKVMKMTEGPCWWSLLPCAWFAHAEIKQATQAGVDLYEKREKDQKARALEALQSKYLE